MDIKSLIEIPHYTNFRIDKMYNIYIIENDEIKDIIPYINAKFIYKDKIFYIINLVNITFYGTENRFEFMSYIKISENEIESNNVKFRSIPGVVDGYFISENGIVFSTFTNKILKQEIDDDGYHRISFPYSHLTHMAIHRLTYKAWKGKIPKGYVIHHEDNVKWNNNINNLQLTTPFLNSRYAAEEGLYQRTFEWTSEIVHHVCRMMEEDICVKDIAAYYNIFPEDKRVYKNFRNQLYNFRTHQRSWIDITSQYNFNDYTGNIRPDSKYRVSDINTMREMYKSGKCINQEKVLMRYSQFIIRHLDLILFQY